MFAGPLDLLTERGGGDYIVRVKSYANVLTEYETHPESKSAGSADVNPRQARGLLERRHVHIVPENIYYIGKESNRLEEVESELEHYLEDVLTGNTMVIQRRPHRSATIALPMDFSQGQEARIERPGLNSRLLPNFVRFPRD